MSIRIPGLLFVVTTGVWLASADTDFFNTSKLDRNPCAGTTDAQATPQDKIVASTVYVPALDQLFVNKHSDKAHMTALVFGRRGTGKSWARFHVVNELANQEKAYVIELTDTGVIDTAWRNYMSTLGWSTLGWRRPDSWSNADLSDLVMQVATHDLLRVVLALPRGGKKLSKFLSATSTKNRQKLANVLYLLAIIYDAPAAIVVEFADILGVNKRRKKRGLGVAPVKYHELVQEVRITTTNNEAGCEDIDDAITDMYPDAWSVESFRKDSGIGHRGYTRIYLIDEIVRALGYTRTVVIVDALDEVPSFQSEYNDGKVSLKKLTPILRSVLDESFLANVNIVAFLPVSKSRISSDMVNHARCGKINCIDLEWDYPLLAKMLDTHWRAAGGELSKFIGGDLTNLTFFKQVSRACTPRNMLIACAKTIEHAVAFRSSNGYTADLTVFRNHLIERGCIELSWWEWLWSTASPQPDSEL